MMAMMLAAAGLAADAATVDMHLRNFVFVPNQVTINVGDTVRFINDEGFHDVIADDGSFSRPAANPGWTFSRTFNAPGVVPVYCSVHSSPGANINTSMNARITVQGTGGFAINQGIAGAWYNPATNGQGFLIDVEPVNKIMFIGWFTYQTSPPTATNKLGVAEHRWLSIQGVYSGATAPLTVYQTSAGVFNRNDPTTTVAVGTATLVFTSCTNATVTYTLTNPALTGTIPIVKLLPGSETLCQSLGAAQDAEPAP
jgi:plastocyanin